MSMAATERNQLSWPEAVAWVAAAAACFHLAYASPRWAVAIVGYLFCLLQLARTGTGRQAFYFGLAAGLLTVAPQLSAFWSIFGPTAIVLWLILAFWIGVFVALARQCLLRLRSVAAVLLIPIVWTGLEYFRSELYYLRFSWLNVGYVFSQTALWPLLRFAGMYGIGFLAMLLAVAFSFARSRRAKVVALALALAGCGLWLLFPVAQAAQTAQKMNGASVEVTAVQLEFPNDFVVTAALDQLLKKAPGASLFVLSEYTFDGPVPERVQLWCRKHHKYLVVGGKDPAPSDNFYDTAFVVGPNGQIIFRQAKAVPIQFFKDGLPARKQRLWNSPWGKIGLCICYDLSYTRVTDELIRLGAQALIVPTMDAESWGGHEHELHARVAPIRAAEYHVPIFRVASSGISQLVDKSGRVTASAPFPGQLSFLTGQMVLGKTGSLPLDRWLAPAAPGVTALLMAWFLIGHLRRNRHFRQIESKRTSEPSGVLKAKTQQMKEELQLRIHSDDSLPTLVYLPGLHGDWTLVGGFRKALAGRVRFVEATYPRTLTWSLDDYAAAMESALEQHCVAGGWLLGESFGSQIVWPMLAHNKFQTQGVILAGGFARHPMRWAVRLAERICGGVSLTLLTRVIFGYAKVARFRYRHSPETLAGIHEFVARRTELDRQAAQHRLRLVARSDPRPVLQDISIPMFALSGFLDPIVPWLFVRHWLRRHCPALRDYKILWCADHNVLGTAPDNAAEQVVRWMAQLQTATQSGKVMRD